MEELGEEKSKVKMEHLKNNLAAKKSRDSRRIRENQMRLRETFYLVTCHDQIREAFKERKISFGSDLFSLAFFKRFFLDKEMREMFFIMSPAQSVVP